MRIKVELNGTVYFGTFLGLTSTEHDDYVGVVRLDDSGLMLTLIHPSKLTPVEGEYQ